MADKKTTRTRVVGTTNIVESLNKGGMAEVFYGIQQPLNRAVAVKVMLPDIADGHEDAEERFVREAQALAELNHENVIAVHDLVEKNNQLFMVMEYVEGVDVSDLLDEVGRLPLDIALLVAVGVVSALEHAHFRNVIHRDIKPGNVMISTRGEVKLTDFGLAKDMRLEDLTRTGLVMGTPSYLAPEQLEGHLADTRTDLYTVGVLLFECLTGEKPFQGNSQAALFQAILAGKPVRPRSLNQQIPRRVDRIIRRCLQADAARRWPRAAALHRALQRELDRVLEGTPSARLVGYLHSRGYVDDDDLSVIDMEDLSFTVAQIEDSEAVDRDATAAATPAARRQTTEPAEEDTSGALTAPVTPGPSRARRILVRGVLLPLAILGTAVAVSWLAAPETTRGLFRLILSWF